MNIIEFFHEIGPLRTRVEATNGVLYNLHDVSYGLGYTRRNSAGRPFVRKERVAKLLGKLGVLAEGTTVNRDHDFNQLWLTEADFFEFAASGSTELARGFRRWIFAEVLPALARHRVFIMDEATPRQISNGRKFRLSSIGQTFRGCVKADFPQFYADFLHYHDNTPYAKRLALLDVIIEVVEDNSVEWGEDWGDILIVLRNQKADWRLVVETNQRRVDTRRTTLARREETARTEVAEQVREQVREEVKEEVRRDVIAEITATRNIVIPGRTVEPTGIIMPFHGYTHNTQYEWILNITEPSGRKAKTFLSEEKWLALKELPLPLAATLLNEHIDCWRTKRYNDWVNSMADWMVNNLPPLESWGITNPEDGVAIYAGFVHIENMDVQNFLKSIVDRIAARYGFDDKFVKLVIGESIGRCYSYQGGRTIINMRPYYQQNQHCQ